MIAFNVDRFINALFKSLCGDWGDGGPGEPDIKGNGVGLNEQPRPTVLQLPVERVGVLLWVVAARFDEETILQFAPVH